jgi:hypothetical protein
MARSSGRVSISRCPLWIASQRGHVPHGIAERSRAVAPLLPQFFKTAWLCPPACDPGPLDDAMLSRRRALGASAHLRSSAEERQPTTGKTKDQAADGRNNQKDSRQAYGAQSSPVELAGLPHPSKSRSCDDRRRQRPRRPRTNKTSVRSRAGESVVCPFCGLDVDLHVAPPVTLCGSRHRRRDNAQRPWLSENPA